MNIDNIHKQSIASISYIVSEYYEHVVTNHRIELITHTIDGIFMHSIYYKELLDMKRLQNLKVVIRHIMKMLNVCLDYFFIIIENITVRYLKN